ncbi:hypothetical protein ANANG_G00008240 [Anguilla anguilla]|uniref:Uncharacterized protein n=1 Tax=Anguilla anguilla TaxID=7936 RepID=A0A9D3N046_ANGAN|nr:hypothetical protein ANANG_G00008240 [Anguilla anguilla]
MRAVSALVLLCVGVLVVSSIQSIRQELSIQALRDHIEKAGSQVRKYEDAIVQAKLKIQEVNGHLSPINSKKAELAKKNQDMGKAGALVLKDIQECQTQKTEAESLMHDAFENLENSKVQRLQAEEEIKKLKQQILDRDTKLCEFVDIKQEQGRKLCGVAESPK